MPLGNGNLAASAHHIRQTLGLTPDDVGLNIMPLFHIHGLIASLLSSMSAGAPVVCTPGFNALKFFQWFSAAGPTWYTAVPTMHQAILGRAGRNQEAVAGSRLLPHDKLDEEVAAVVVFKQDQSADAAEIPRLRRRAPGDLQGAEQDHRARRDSQGGNGHTAADRTGRETRPGVMPRIAIYGAGAIGGYLGAKLATTDAEVSLIARGPHLEAIRTNGLTLIEDGKRQTFELTATDDTSELGRQDLVFVTLKAHSIPAGVEPLRCLLGPDTAVVFAVNGAPWWYFHGLDGPYSGHRLETVDPGGVIWSGIGPQRAIGCVVYPAAEVTEPGVVSHRSGDRFSLGEPTGERSERVEALSRLLIAAGLKAPIRPRIRDEIWVKLWGNASFNPVSALTGATLAEIGRDPDTRTLIGRLMAEIQAVGEALDVRFKVDIDKRIDGAVAVGEHKTSMLQDLEKGRPMEIDALIGAVQELGVLVGEPTPTLDTVLALVKQRARLAGCYPS